VAEATGRLSTVSVLAEESVSTAESESPVGVVSLAAGGVSFMVGVTDGGGVHTAVLRESTSRGIGVGSTGGGVSDSLRSFVRRIHPSPRIETVAMAMGIQSSRLKEGRGCISGKILLRLYSHSFP
jgi:hypothetical protein